MKRIVVFFNVVLIIIILNACGNSSTKSIDLPQIALKSKTYLDTTKQVSIKLNLPSDHLLDNTEKKDFLNVVFDKKFNNVDSLIEIAFRSYRNMSVEVNVLYINDKVISAKFITKNWIEGGDTLVNNNYISYLRNLKKKLTIRDIINTHSEVDQLAEKINRNTKGDVFLSPDVDITVLGNHIVFHYDRLYQRELNVSLPLDEILEEFNKFKLIYNE